jgi:cytochrome b involved in lipid metabolism
MTNNKVAFFGIFLALVVFIVYLLLMQDKEVAKKSLEIESLPDSTFDENLGVYSLEDISLRSSRENCWIVINGEVYDVTDYVNLHPGGESILEGCGKDATLLFETRPSGSGTPHSSMAREIIIDYKIGILK